MAQFARLKPATILVVEDEAIVRLELAAWFTELGLTVLTACDADEAIAILDRRPEIELLMTDIKMSGSMDGLRLAHHVRHRWPPVKIIVASGLIDTQIGELPAGSFFLPKPFERRRLWRALADMAGDGRVQPPAGQAA
jgi:DNA-binding NtrC family response regulator